ncbi:hypothetical protein D6C91_03130 [Aureobasidium pullulans]|uniref:Uncharacterized protein n=1 Tax=Aureobasidium pullulans TaxID=5580 RepID=A0A4S9TJ30_AURPU|nr:hypothetical protein D6C91_03130 [Aureobasidium pullulans]
MTMPILLTSLLGTAVGSAVVYFTSPTLAAVLAGSTLDWVALHSLAIDALFAILICFFILCYLETKWIAVNQSFPYTFHLKNNLGKSSFDFQLVVFELWHTNKLNRYGHMVCLFCEQLLWLHIIRITFGVSGLALTNIALGMQAFSFGDLRLAFGTTIFNAAYSLLGMWALDGYSPVAAIDICKITLFWVVVVRTAVHAAEPLPPVYDSETDSFGETWGDDGYKLISKNPLGALWLFILGIVSELASGVPGRLFGTALYKALYRAGGFRSSTLKGVDTAREEALSTLKNGWASNEMLAPYFLKSSSVVIIEKLPLEC